MSTLTKILAGLNLFVALLLFFLASSVIHARSNWTKLIDDRKAIRDGLAVADDAERDPILGKLDPEARRRLLSEFQSRYQRRQEAVRTVTKEQPLSEEAQKLIREIGPDDYRRLVHRVIVRERPKTSIEEQNLAVEKALLQDLRTSHETEIANLEVKIRWLTAKLEQEKALEAKVVTENADRRREITQLYSELEEAYAARNLALKQLADMQAYLELTQNRVQELTKQNATMAQQIAQQEAEKVTRKEGGQ